MTYKEQFMLDHPDWPEEAVNKIINYECPSDYYEDEDEPICEYVEMPDCEECWNREVPDTKGRWVDPEDDDGGTTWHCNKCLYPVKTMCGTPNYNYCPNCGKKMV